MKELKFKIEKLNIYPEKNIDKVVTDIKNCDSTIYDAITNWLDTKAEINVTIDGVTYDSLKEVCQMNPIAAYLTLDWILRKKESALKILKKEYPKLFA